MTTVEQTVNITTLGSDHQNQATLSNLVSTQIDSVTNSLTKRFKMDHYNSMNTQTYNNLANNKQKPMTNLNFKKSYIVSLFHLLFL